MTTLPAPASYVIEDNGTLRTLLKTHVVSLEHDILNALQYRELYRSSHSYTPPTVHGGVIFYRPGHELPVRDEDLQRVAEEMQADGERLYNEWLTLVEKTGLPLDYMAYFATDGVGTMLSLARNSGVFGTYGRDFDRSLHSESHAVGQRLAKQVLRAYRARSIKRFEALGL